MKLNSALSRRLMLAGTVEFPTPYPTVGTISIETHQVHYPPDDRVEEEVFVVVQELQHLSESVTRVIAKEHVAAIVFVGGGGKKGAKEDKGNDENGFARCAESFDAETCIWFLKPDIDLKKIAKHLGIGAEALAGRDSPARGIVFVPEFAPVLSMCESTQIAAEAAEAPHPRHRIMYCQCGCSCCN